jgi:outer membrane protein assembly factor BamB
VTVFLASVANVVFAEKQLSVDSQPMFHNDLAHHGYSTSIAPETNQTLWTFSIGGQVGSPLVVGGIVYVGSYDHKVYAFNVFNVL